MHTGSDTPEPVAAQPVTQHHQAWLRDLVQGLLYGSGELDGHTMQAIFQELDLSGEIRRQ